MRLEDCFFLGTLTKKHGTQGALVLKLDTDKPESYHNLESALLLLNGELIPFFIKTCTPLKPELLRIELEDISFGEAEKLIGTEVYLPLSRLPQLTGKNFYYHEVQGFTAVDHLHGSIGIIEEVIDRPEQPLFLIKNKEKEIFIPAVDDFINQIDRKENVVYFQCPEGLIDIYL